MWILLALLMADVFAHTTEVALPNVTGNFEVTISGIGTPKAVRMIVIDSITNGTPSSQSSQQGANISYGFCDGTREWAVAMANQTNVGTSQLTRNAMSDETIHSLHSTTIRIEASGVGDGSGTNPGPITDGWRFNVGAESTAQSRIAKVTFFGGADLSVRVNITPAISSSLIDITDIGFEPEIIYSCGNGDAMADSISNFGLYCLGSVHNDGAGGITQKAIAFGGEDGQASSNNFTYFFGSKGMAQLIASTGAVSYSIDFSDFDANGFSITPVTSAGGDKFGYAAFKFGGGDSKVWSQDSPTSTSVDYDITAPAFTPIFMDLFTSYLTTEDTQTTDATAYSHGLVSFDGTREHSAIVSSEDNQSTMDNQSLVDDQFINMPSPDGVQKYDLSSPTFNSNGLTVASADIVAANTTARKWFGVAIGAAAVGVTLPIIAGGGGIAGDGGIAGIGGIAS